MLCSASTLKPAPRAVLQAATLAAAEQQHTAALLKAFEARAEQLQRQVDALTAIVQDGAGAAPSSAAQVGGWGGPVEHLWSGRAWSLRSTLWILHGTLSQQALPLLAPLSRRWRR